MLSLMAALLLGSVSLSQTITQATGGSAISADSTGKGFIALTGPAYAEGATGNVGLGTIILKAPAGFIFDKSGTPAPTVLITRIAGSGPDSRNINNVASGTSVAISSITDTTITFTVTDVTTNAVRNSLTWQNIRVRPSAGTPLASGSLTISVNSTSTLAGVTRGVTSFGTLTEVVGAHNKLVVTLPTQTFVEGSGNNANPVTAQTAGVSFTITRITATDQFFNIYTSYSGTKILTYLGPGGTPTYTTSVSFTGGQSTTPLTTILRKAETTTISVIEGAITGPASSSLVVNPAPFTKLQVLVIPGDTAAAGTATGKTGSPSVQTAGTAFSVTVNAVDSCWNVVSSTDSIGITSSDTNAALSPNARLVGGTKNFSVILKAAVPATVTATDLSDGSKTANTSSSIPVNPGGFVKLQVLLPGETVRPGTFAGKTGSAANQTAGTAFYATVRAVDDYWNLISSVSDQVQLTSTDSNATLPGVTPLSGGEDSMAVTFHTAGNWTLKASDVTDPGKGKDTSSTVTVDPGAFARLQLLVPGETANPGTASGKAGAPDPQNAGAAFWVTVKGTDWDWNWVTTASPDTVRITSSDGTAILPPNAPLVGGVVNFQVTLNTAPDSATITATDKTSGLILWDQSPYITVNPSGTGTLTAASGGGAISSDNAGGSYTALTGPVYEEGSSGNVLPGTIILDVPSGFAFDTGGTTPTILITRTAGTGDSTRNINSLPDGGAITASSVTATQISFTITSPSNNTVTNSLTWQNIRVRPTSGTPLAAGNITKSGTSTVAGVTGSTNFGTLTQVPGAHTRLLVVLPGQSFVEGTGVSSMPDSQSAGISFAISSIRATDQYYNTVSSYSGIKTLSYSGPGGVPTYTTGVSFTGGVSTTTLTTTLTKAQDTTISVDDETVSGPASSTLTVKPNSFTKLQILVPGETADPGTSSGKTGTPTDRTAGTSFNVTVNAADNYWNKVATAPTDSVQITSSDVNALLPANGALAGGTQTFSVTFLTGGSHTLTAMDITNGLKTPDTSPSVLVNPGTFSKLQLLVPGEVADPGSTAGKSGTPNDQARGSSFNITVNAVDANWNVVTTAPADTIGVTSSDGAATLPPNNSLSGGTQTFVFAFNTAGSQTITASDLTNGTITTSTSPSITVSDVVITSAAGGDAISADDSGATYTTLTGPVYAEGASGNAGTGTIILDVPDGFVFDAGGTPPTVLITRIAGSGPDSRNINGVAGGTSVAVSGVTSTQITFTVTSASTGGVRNSLTWQNVRVRPAEGSLASGNITKSGTSLLAGVMADVTNFGTLTEVAGAVYRLVITLPGQTFIADSGNSGTPDVQTAASPFVLTSITAIDKFFNIATQYSGSKTISYSGPSGSPSYTETVDFAAGVSATTLTTTLTEVETTTITATDGTVEGLPSSLLTIIAPVKTWAGGASGIWNSPGNWSPVGVPTSLNDVNLTSAASITVDVAAQAKNLTLDNAGATLTIQSGQSLAVAGNLSLVNGALVTEASFPSVSGSVTITNATVSYAATSDQSVEGLAYHTLTISGSGTKTLTGGGSIAADLTVAGGTLNLGAQSINRLTPGGTITVNTGAVLRLGGNSGGITGSNFPTNFTTRTLNGTVVFNYEGDQTMPPVVFTDLVLEGSGTKYFGAGTTTINGSLTTAGTASSNAIANAATVVFGGTVSQTVLSMSYYNLTVTGTSAKSAEGDVTVTNNFSNTAEFSMGTYTLSIGGTTANSGTMKFAGAANGLAINGGTVEYNGAAGQTVAPGTYGTLVFSNSGAKTLSADVTVQTALNVGVGATATISGGVNVQVNGSVANAGTLINNGTIIVGTE